MLQTAHRVVIIIGVHDGEHIKQACCCQQECQEANYRQIALSALPVLVFGSHVGQVSCIQSAQDDAGADLRRSNLPAAGD